MRTRNFFLSAETKTSAGSSVSFTGTTVSDSEIGSTNIAFIGAVLKGDDDGDPYGSVNVFATSRTISNGSVSNIEFEKSGISAETTDSIDIVSVIARG